MYESLRSEHSPLKVQPEINIKGKAILGVRNKGEARTVYQTCVIEMWNENNLSVMPSRCN